VRVLLLLLIFLLHNSFAKKIYMTGKILIIEDEIDLADNLRSLLEFRNYKVITAKDGTEGIELTRKHLPDLIICDIMMPGTDGFKVKETLNMNGDTSLIPFIFLTAKVDYSDYRMGMSLGADDYLFKPFRSEDLFNSITTRLKKTETIKAQFSDARNNHSIENNNTTQDSILVKINNTSVFIKFKRIKVIIAERQYSNLWLNDNKRIIIRKSLNEWEKILPLQEFLRIHRKTIVNINYVEYISKSDPKNLKVIIKNNTGAFEISRRYGRKIREIFSV